MMAETATSVGRLYREQLIDHIKDNVENKSNLFLVNYQNLSGIQMSELRKDLKKIGADVFVARNRLARLAFKDLEKEELIEKLDGQTALIWSEADSVEVSKLLVKFAKDFEGLVIQGGLLQERILVQDDVKRLADLPSKDALRAQVLGIIQAPITRLLSAMNAKSRDLLSILKQLSEKKEGN